MFHPIRAKIGLANARISGMANASRSTADVCSSLAALMMSYTRLYECVPRASLQSHMSSASVGFRCIGSDW
jgi:hypothetical protein